MFCKRNICSSYPIILQRRGKESADGKMEGVVQPQQSSFCYLFGLMLEGFVRYLEVWNLEKSDRADSPELVRCSWALSTPPLLWEGILCSVWMRKWYKNRDWVSSHRDQFIEVCKKMMRWEDASLSSVFGFCLPSPPGYEILPPRASPPLHTYLRHHKSDLAKINLLETSACLARALHYLSDNGIVHGEIRARNVFLSQ